MTTDFRALCAELVEKLDELDRLLHGAQYVEHPLTYRARAALSAPEGPTLDDIWELCEEHGFMLGIDGANEEESASGLWAIARAVLARWGNHPESPDSPPQPQPVSERLPGPEDCDAKGRCWIGRPEYTFPMGDTGSWGHADPEWCLEEPREAANSTAVWLPAHALPVPGDD